MGLVLQQGRGRKIPAAAVWASLAAACGPTCSQASPIGAYHIVALGLTGSSYSYTQSDATYGGGYAIGMNASGRVVGESTRRNASAASLGLDAWQAGADGTTIVIGLFGAAYDYAYGGTGGGVFHNVVSTSQNAAGDAVGYSDRYSGAGVASGRDVWLMHASVTQLIGLVGTDYEYGGTAGTAVRNSTVANLNSAGQAIGYSIRYNAAGTAIGQDAWMAGGTMSGSQQVGFVGAGYEYAFSGTGGGTYRYSLAKGQDATGHVVGYSSRYDAQGNSLGSDAWLTTDSGTTQQIGFTGDIYERSAVSPAVGTYRSSTPFGISASGQVAGTSQRYNASGSYVGSDAWLVSGSGTQLIGLTGSGYESGLTRDSGVSGLCANGTAYGYSSRYNSNGYSLGADGWLATSAGTVRIGLTGTGYEYTSSNPGGGKYRNTVSFHISDTGMVDGYSRRYNTSNIEIGHDAFVATTAGTWRVGLIGTGYEYTYSGTGGGTYRTSSVSASSTTGYAVGYSDRYNSLGFSLGRDAWVATTSGTRLAGLTGPGYESPGTDPGGGTYRLNTPLVVNTHGDAIGTTHRYGLTGAGNAGTAGWFFDGDTGLTTSLEFSFRSSNNWVETSPMLLSDDRVVLGQYRLYSGDTDMGLRAFWWSSGDGFHDVGSLVSGGLTAAGWQYLSSIYDSSVPGVAGSGQGVSPLYILGTGQMITPTGQPYLLSVPEPTPYLLSVGLLLIAGCRRRKRMQQLPA